MQFDKKKKKILELYQSKPKRQRMFKGERLTQTENEGTALLSFLKL